MATGTLRRRELFGILALSTTRGVARGARLLETDRPTGVPVTQQRHYRVHATIYFLGVPLFSKDNVGGASIMLESTSGMTAIQLASGSWPERLKGFNRFGMAQEAVLEENGGIAESAYLSFMTSSAEKNFEQAKQSFLERASAQQISVAHGRSSRTAYVSALDHLTVPAHSTWADCPRLIAEMKDRISPLKESPVETAKNFAYPPFLHSVRGAMAGAAPWAESLFVHNAKLFRLRTRTSPAREGTLLAGKIAERGTTQESEFRVWFDPRDPSGLPVRFEFRPKSFLHLVFEQDPGVSAPRFSSLIAKETA